MKAESARLPCGSVACQGTGQSRIPKQKIKIQCSGIGYPTFEAQSETSLLQEGSRILPIASSSADSCGQLRNHLRKNFSSLHQVPRPEKSDSQSGPSTLNPKPQTPPQKKREPFRDAPTESPRCSGGFLDWSQSRWDAKSPGLTFDGFRASGL